MDILREEAREEGRVEVREYCALMMIRRGMDVDTIREISRLDLQRILELRSEITPWLSFSNWVGQLTKIYPSCPTRRVSAAAGVRWGLLGG